MRGPSRSTLWIVWGGLTLTVGAIIVAFVRERLERPSTPPLPVLFSVPSFTLTNQTGARFSSEALRGHVWLSDIVFTRCAGPCPIMTGLMAEVQSAVPAAAKVRFVTLTTDPDFDTPEVLARYGRRYGVDWSRWSFLTGAKDELRKVAVDGLKFTAIEKPATEQESASDLFIHSTVFVLVDGKGFARAVFESTEPDCRERILAAIDALLRE